MNSQWVWKCAIVGGVVGGVFLLQRHSSKSPQGSNDSGSGLFIAAGSDGAGSSARISQSASADEEDAADDGGGAVGGDDGD